MSAEPGVRIQFNRQYQTLVQVMRDKYILEHQRGTSEGVSGRHYTIGTGGGKGGSFHT